MESRCKSNTGITVTDSVFGVVWALCTGHGRGQGLKGSAYCLHEQLYLCILENCNFKKNCCLDCLTVKRFVHLGLLTDAEQ